MSSSTDHLFTAYAFVAYYTRKHINGLLKGQTTCARQHFCSEEAAHSWAAAVNKRARSIGYRVVDFAVEPNPHYAKPQTA